MSRTKPSAKQPTMQKKGEISDDSARARTLKYVPKYVDHVPLKDCQQYHKRTMMLAVTYL